MTTDSFIKVIPQNGMTYSQYKEYFEQDIKSRENKELNSEDKELLDTIKLNLVRTNRVEKVYSVSDELSEIVKDIKEPQWWMVITEDWCGDSAQNLPYIAKIAAVNPLIHLNIILRDKNLDIIDRYQTNGTRSIPKMVAFDENENELFIWGPRPKGAVEVIKQAKEEKLPKKEMYEKLHLWYGRNKGAGLEAEFISLLGKYAVILK